MARGLNAGESAMNETLRACNACGAVIPPDAPEALCPQCLLRSDPKIPKTPTTSAPTVLRPVPDQDFGPYRILRLLGQGGMGSVFEAEHKLTGRRLALKVMNHPLAAEADRKRFLREGRLAAAVNHPNVVPIYSGEEVNGIPTIAMELVRGGTLADRLRARGPLPIQEAIEASLQIIAGLEAAHAAGVLHRDIKPANCFVSADGAIKVGDFGLSVSTLARGESYLTTQGRVLGTPAYAPPEQLRGEDLQVSADIYSVGATLYHLVTGRPPFAAEDLVKLISSVLDRNPPAPNSLQPAVPAELSRIILRCLAKDPKARFQNYDQLRDALLPFHVREAEPAPPALRFLAGLFDDLLIASAPVLLAHLWMGMAPEDYALRERMPIAFGLWIGTLAWSLFYYGLSEGLWGAGIGKMMCGLRVVGPDRQIPGVARALWRAAIFHAPSILPGLASLIFISAEHMKAILARGEEPTSVWLGPVMFLALFVCARRRNGYAALHDRFSQTRVLLCPRSQNRPSLAELQSRHGSSLPIGYGVGQAQTGVLSFGPYEACANLMDRPEESLWLARDPQLRRMIWIHARPADSAAVAPARQELSRPARLRWLNHGQFNDRRWDAYEAVEGMPLLSCPRPMPWHAVRCWLLDLSHELVQPVDEATSTPLGLDRVWISASGRAFLLDIPCPDTVGRRKTEDSASQSRAQRERALDGQQFLSAVARRALEGPDSADCIPKKQTCAPRVPVPLAAREFLQRMTAGTFEKMEFVAGNLESLAQKTAFVTRGRRAASLLLAPGVLTLFSLLISGLAHFDDLRKQREWAMAYPGRPPLVAASRLYLQSVSAEQEGLTPPHESQKVRTYLMSQYTDVITNDSFWLNPNLSGDITLGERALLVQAVHGFQPPTQAARQTAEREIGPEVARIGREDRIEFWFFFLILWFCGWTLWGTLEFLAAWKASPGLAISAVGLAVVDLQGRPASRWRLLWRWLLVWGGWACLAGLAAFLPLARDLASGLLFPLWGLTEPTANRWSFVLLGIAIFLGVAALVRAVLRPDCGWPDLLAGTRIVVR